MKLRRLTISRLPGIDDPFTVDGISDGFNVIVGPNAMGKSSLCRAMTYLLWPSESARPSTGASALFEDESGQWLVHADGQLPRWQLNGIDSDPPRLPADHLSQCFFLRLPDLIELTQNPGHEIAAAIRRQMAGGFDLEQLASEFSSKAGKRPGRTERASVTEINKEIRKAELAQIDLSHKQSKLDELDMRVAAADDAQKRVPRVEDAIRLRELRDKLAGVTEALQLMPAALENLTGNEVGDLESIESDLESKEGKRSGEERNHFQAIADRKETGLEERIPQSVLSIVRTYANSLADLETQSQQAKKVHEGKKADLAQARRACGGNDDVPANMNLPAASQLFAFLRERNSISTGLSAIDEQIRILDESSPLEDDPGRAELLARAISSLRAWLRTPTTSAAQQSGVFWLPRKWVFGLAAVFLALGAALSVTFHFAFLTLVGLGLGLGISGWLLRIVTRSRPSTADTRSMHQDEFPSDLGAPDAWSAESVTTRLHELEMDLVALKAARQQITYRTADRQRLKVKREQITEKQNELDSQKQALAQEIHLETILPDAELVDMARAMDHLRIAIRDERSAAAEMEALEVQRSEVLGKLSEILTRYGEESPTDAATARAGAENLAAREQTFEKAKATAESARQQLQQSNDDIASLERRKREIYERAGLETDDRSGLERLLEALERYKEKVIRKEGRSEAIATLESTLRSTGAADLLDHDLAQLEAESSRLKLLIEDGTTLRSRISDIKSEITRAADSRDLEALIDSRDRAMGVLRDRRDAVLYGAAGEFLVRQVQDEYELNRMPRVLERARTFFGEFTHHSYELRIPQDDQQSFLAIDARTRHGHQASELSDGTRAQLLLASRLAFADEAEQGVQLPLFLDEALDQSDPPRYRAIVASLGRLVAEENRQIFYLTTDPMDLQRIQEALAEEACNPATVIDLAEVRRRGTSVTSIDSLNVPPLPTVRLPGSMTPEEYAVELSVPQFDPRRGYRAQHLIYILWDDLQTLQALVGSRIDRVGNWLTLCAHRAPFAISIAAGAGAGSQLNARSQLLAAFCDGFAEGRGRKVDGQAIEDSSAVTSRYMGHVVDICTELEGDGERLVQALRARTDPRLPGFRANATDALEKYLIDESYIDPRPVLSESDLSMRVLADPSMAQLPAEVAAECVHRWWTFAKQLESR